MRVLAFAVAFALAAPSQAQQPKSKETAFGFWKGMTLKQAQAAAPLEAPRAGGYPIYSTEKPPQPVSPFIRYGVFIGKASGVCGVVARTEVKRAGSNELNEMRDRIIKLVKDQHGEPTQIEEGQSPPRLNWVNAQGANTQITLKVHHLDTAMAVVMLDYRFSNSPDCLREAREGL